MSATPGIVILGAGFAALAAARDLRRLRPRAKIRLVAPARRFVYRPSLIWVPVGLRKPSQIQVPLAPFLSRHAIDFTPASVTGLADGGRTVLTTRGRVRNDALIIATGAGMSNEIEGAEHALGICEGVLAADRVRERLVAMRGGRIAIGCGEHAGDPGATRCGPMCELLFGIDTWLRRRGMRERFELTFFSDGADPLKRFGQGPATRVHEELERRGIESRTGLVIKEFSAAGVHAADGDIEAGLVVFTPALSGPAWSAQSPLPRSASGFIVADEYCAVAGHEHVYVAGDAGAFPGPAWSPKLAHMARIEAGVAAANLHAVLSDEEPEVLLHHELACVIDTLEGGMMLYRDDGRALATPAAAPMHWAKRVVERRYLDALAE